MGLSAHAAELLARLNDGLPPVETLPPVDARQRMVDKRLRAAPAEQVAVGAVEHVLVPTRSHEARVRLYHPAGNEPAPVVVFFHGGGWVLCDLDSHDSICRRLCAGAGCVVASVEYRLAPEDPFPAAVHDAIDVTTWIAAHSEVVGGRAGALAVAGDSAGGNLAAVVTQLARARGGPAIAFQALVYPVTDFDFSTASYREFGVEGNLTEAAMRWYWSNYLGDADGGLALASPLRAADLSGLPPALVITAEADPLRDEGEAYAHRLRAAGGQVNLTRYAGMFHGFLGYAGVLAEADAAGNELCKALRDAFA